jgi:hypothetical protein
MEISIVNDNSFDKVGYNNINVIALTLREGHA